MAEFKFVTQGPDRIVRPRISSGIFRIPDYHLFAFACLSGCGVFRLEAGPSHQRRFCPARNNSHQVIYRRVGQCQDCHLWLIYVGSERFNRCDGKGSGYHGSNVVFEAEPGTTDPKMFLPPPKPSAPSRVLGTRRPRR